MKANKPTARLTVSRALACIWPLDFFFFGLPVSGCVDRLTHYIYIYNPFTLDKLVSVDVKHHVYLQSAQSPGEIKRREVSWTLTKKVRLIGGSRRDQEEGGGAGLSKWDFFAAVVTQQQCYGR